VTALIVTLSVIGSVLLGYFVYAVPSGPADALYFSDWLARPVRFAVYGWVLLGVGVGFTIRYLTR
jgi:hypothetical protein